MQHPLKNPLLALYEDTIRHAYFVRLLDSLNLFQHNKHNMTQ